MGSLSIPPPYQAFTYPRKENSKDGMITEPWYRIMSEIGRLRTELDTLRSDFEDLKRLTPNMGAIDISWGGTSLFVGST